MSTRNRDLAKGQKSSDNPGSYGNAPAKPDADIDPLTNPDAVLSGEDRIRAYWATRDGYASAVQEHYADKAIAEAGELGMNAEFMADYLEAVEHLGARRNGLPGAGELHDSGFTAQDMVDMVELNISRHGTNAAYHLLIGDRVDAVRVTHLIDLGLPADPSVISAFSDATDEEVRSWMNARLANRGLANWADDWNTGALRRAGVSAELAVAFSTSGVDSFAVAQNPHTFSPGEARAFSLESGLNPANVGAYMSHNIEFAGEPRKLVSAATAKAYGPNFEPREVADLADQNINAKAARSLRGVDKSMAVSTIARFTSAGIVSGAEYRGWRSLTAVPGEATDSWPDLDKFVVDRERSVQRILAAKSTGASVATASAHYASGFKLPEQWAALASVGIVDTEPWKAQWVGCGRSTSFVFSNARDRATVVAEGLAAWAAAGGTPERLGAAQRAGISIDIAHQFVDSDDLWADGAESRKATVRWQRHVASGRSWMPVPGPWEYTKATYARLPNRK